MGGIAVLIRAQLAQWCLEVSVKHFNTELWERRSGATGQFGLANLVLFFVNTWRLSWTVASRRPLLVHYHTSLGLAVLKDTMLAFWLRWILRRPVILQIHFADVDYILLSRAKLLRRLQLVFLMISCDRIALLSQSIERELAAILSPRQTLLWKKKATILPNFTALPTLPRRRPVTLLPVGLFFIGNIGWRKGAYDLLRASLKLKTRGTAAFEVVFAGPFDSSKEERQFRGVIRELGLEAQVRLLGSVAGKAKEEAFLAADVFVLPSYGEGVPVALIEAMAYGLPAVVTSVGGIPETVTDGGEGFIIRPGDIDSLAERLSELIADEDLRMRMGSAGRLRALEQHSPKAYFDALGALYASI